MANAIRFLAIDAVEKAKSGHPGMPMGMADVATVLFSRFLKFDPADPAWPDRDRFVLSAGHGSMLLYALLHLTGYEGVTIGRAQGVPAVGIENPRPSRIRPYARRRDDHRAAGAGDRHRGRHGAGRAADERALRRRSRRSLHLCDRRRRLPDGGHQPRGDLAGRASQAWPPDRAVRRQRNLDRRRDLAVMLGRPARALQGVRLVGEPDRRPRSRGDRRRDRAGAARATGRR